MSGPVASTMTPVEWLMRWGASALLDQVPWGNASSHWMFDTTYDAVLDMKYELEEEQ